jgi:hypothetical protein
VDTAGNVLSEPLTGARSPALRVTGVHRPALTHHYELLAGGGFRIHGRAYWTDTRRPIARHPLAAGYDSSCDMEGAANNIVTDGHGRGGRPAGRRAQRGLRPGEPGHMESRNFRILGSKERSPESYEHATCTLKPITTTAIAADAGPESFGD